MKNSKLCLLLVLGMICSCIFVRFSFGQQCNNTGLCNTNCEVYAIGEPSCTGYMGWDWTIYWGGVSGSASYATLLGSSDCEYYYVCTTDEGDNGYCTPSAYANTGYFGSYYSPSGATFYAALQDYSANRTIYDCPPGYPGFEGLGVGFEYYCTANTNVSTERFGPCN
jgi:hypothetical protein